MQQEEETLKGFRLSPQQKRLWLLGRSSQAYQAQSAIRIEGALDKELMKAACESVVRRHEILRTTFEHLPGMRVPVQIIGEQTYFDWRETDLCGWAQDQQQAQLEELFEEQRLLPYDFERGPMLRLILCALAADSHILIVNLPSLCADAWTLKNLLREISNAYAPLLEGEGMAAEPVQYVQFSEWQNGLFEEEDEGKAEGRWRQNDVSAIPLTLPCEARLSVGEEFAPQCFTLELTEEMRLRLEARARSRNSTVASLLLASFETLLVRLTKQTDITVNLLCDGRVYEEMHEACGLFARWPLVECHLEEEFSFLEVLDHVGERVRHAREWQEYFSWEQYAGSEESSLVKSFSAIGFDYEEWPAGEVAAGLRFSIYQQYSCTDRFKLRLSCVRTENSLSVSFHYDPTVYALETVRRLAVQFEMVLQAVTRDMQVRVGQINILGEAERRRLLLEWNETQRGYRSNACLHHLFEAQVERSPTATAVVSADAQLSYFELNRRANQLAHHLLSLGVGPEVRVGLYLERSVEMVVGLLAILKAGGAYLPLDITLPKARLATMLQNAGAPIVLTDQSLSDALPAQQVSIVHLDADAEMIARQSAENPCSRATAENLAYVICTSGSTGRPKGVMIQHRSVVNLSESLKETIYGPEQTRLRVSINAPLAFDSSVKQVVQLLHGHALYIVPEEVRPDGEGLLSFVRAQRLDVLDCTPSQLRLMLMAGLGSEEWETSPALVLVGGEALDEATWQRLAEIKGMKFYNLYGPTECAVDTTMCRVEKGSPTIGRPLGNVRAYVLDRQMQLAPLGVAGELHIGGEGVGRGYLAQPEQTAERFIPDPFSVEPGKRLYRSGDLVRYLADGRLEFLGRIDNQVKVRGFRIEPEEIEAVLAEHRAVKQSVVVARAHASGEKYLAAYIVAARESVPTRDELRALLRTKLPEQMVPSAFVILDKLPLTPNGKVDRQALPEPDNARPELKKAYVAPRTPVEEVVAGIWAEVLQLKQVGVHDNFFDLGGHSLLVTQVISRVREAFEIELSLRSLFETYTVAGLSEVIEKAKHDRSELPTPAITRVSREAYRVKLSAQGTLEIPKA